MIVNFLEVIFVGFFFFRKYVLSRGKMKKYYGYRDKL